MNTKTPRKIFIASVITGIACLVFVVTFVRSVAYSPEAEIDLPAVQSGSVLPGTSPSPSVPSAGLAANVPVGEYPDRLSIPSLGIDAHVQHVGIAKSGNMAPPNNFSDAGWYKYGTVPGYRGSAVFAGHVDNALALPGVFKRLSEIRRGNMIEVRAKDGTVKKFRVTDVSSYEYTAVPTDLIFNQNDKSRIRLITCGGSWIQSAKSYDKRVVVTAELVG